MLLVVLEDGELEPDFGVGGLALGQRPIMNRLVRPFPRFRGLCPLVDAC